ncbi:hypothetical protein BDEG_21156 [Batrachochytrium dendrobatidis JEL423]|uniref:Acetyl-coenzyme A transporter 1 n=1 Tax=Batrachochytrium dendrobatidis (strain JEL423) TaxID=403673 RepID=A0A177WAF1_BATDL|nr:hypothetical protein BDEG_21156 [Batrachochytrium dendrobatidis JEL423]
MAGSSKMTRRTSSNPNPNASPADEPLLYDSYDDLDLVSSKDRQRSKSKESVSQPGSEVGLGKDLGNMVLLVFLYLLQGVPLGLSMGSVPFLLKSKLGFGDLALFSLSSYPYSLKLLWSPIVDSTYNKSIGRRKSWIVPIQAILGISLLVLGGYIDPILAQDKLPLGMLATVFTFMVFLCATQDIAVDDVRINCSNNWSEHGLLPVVYCISSSELARTMAIELTDVSEIKEVYHTMVKIIMLPHMKTFIAVLLVAKLGFVANDAVTGLKLLEKGFSKEDLALAVLIDFPFQIVFGYYAAKWSNGSRPLKPWLWAFYGRLFAAFLGMVMVYFVPQTGITTSFFTIVIIGTVFSSFMSVLQFIGMGSFFTKISDPAIGG